MIVVYRARGAFGIQEKFGISHCNNTRCTRGDPKRNGLQQVLLELFVADVVEQAFNFGSYGVKNSDVAVGSTHAHALPLQSTYLISEAAPTFSNADMKQVVERLPEQNYKSGAVAATISDSLPCGVAVSKSLA